jgi:hypothetical protein
VDIGEKASSVTESSNIVHEAKIAKGAEGRSFALGALSRKYEYFLKPERKIAFPAILCPLRGN